MTEKRTFLPAALAPLLAALLFLISSTAVAGLPLSWTELPRTAPEALDAESFEALDLEALAAEDQYNEILGQPPRFAVPREVSISALARGDWAEAGEMSIWRFRVTADAAVNLNFAFAPFRLPEGAGLYLYTVAAAERGEPDRYQVIGPYTHANNNAHGQLWTPIIQGHDVIIELNVPTRLRDRVELELARVNQGYRAFGEAALGYRQMDTLVGEGKQSSTCKDGTGKDGTGGTRSGTCNMDVACLADDDPWNDPRRSVGAYSRSGSFACTGSLVNNTAGDRRMLFITATHCGVNAGSAPSLVVYWNYEWPTCRTPGAPEGGQVNPPDPSLTNSGATFLAATSNPFSGQCTAPNECSDVSLSELDDPANPEFDLYWSGWDRRDLPAACGPQGAPGSTDGLCATIHHPGVDEKRITFVETDFLYGSIAGASNIHWHAFWHTSPPVVANIPEPQPSSIPPGVTEPGSSGSPLYSADQRFVGVLSGGPAACGATGNNLSDFYGQLANAWEGMGTPATRMRDHLDPLGTNPEFIDGIGMSPFSLEVDPPAVAVCAAAGSIDLLVDVEPDPGFTDPVSLSASGGPAGAGLAFNPQVVNPPGTSVLTVDNLGSATPGDTILEVLGVSGDDETASNVPFTLNDAAPSAVGLESPADGALGLGSRPTLSWTGTATAGATDYLVEVATDPGFTQVAFSRTVTGSTSVQVDPALETSTDYYWRVTASNACGSAESSAVFQFRTAPAPGDCDPSTTKFTLFFDDVDDGPGSWSTAGSSGAQTWSRSTARPNSGTHAWFAPDIPTASDQRLISEPIELPFNENPLTLSFENWREIEINTATGCYDGGILEVSADGGPFEQVPNELIIDGGGYRGPISTSFGNPLGGLQAWCDDPARPYTVGPVRVDLSGYQGQTVQLRFRLGTDTSVAKEGWYVDDIEVTSCRVAEEVIFADGFESGDF